MTSDHYIGECEDITQESFPVDDFEHENPKTLYEKICKSSDSIMFLIFMSSLLGLNIATGCHPAVLEPLYHSSTMKDLQIWEVLTLFGINIVFSLLLLTPFLVAAIQQWRGIQFMHPNQPLSNFCKDMLHVLCGYSVLCWFSNNWMIFLRFHTADSGPLLRVLLRYTMIHDIFLFLYILFSFINDYRETTLNSDMELSEVHLADITEHRREENITETEDQIIANECVGFCLSILFMAFFVCHTTWHFRISM